MSESSNNEVALVIAERGSAWEPWVERYRARDLHVVTAVQERGETLSTFAVRLRSRVEELASTDQQILRAVLVGAPRAQRESLRARSLIIRAVAANMSHGGGGVLLLEDHEDDGYAMRALAATVQGMVRGTGVDVRYVRSGPDSADDEQVA